MHRLACFSLGGLFAATAFGQNPLQCVDPDVLQALVFRASADQSTVVTAAVPDELSAVKPPSQFTLIGGIERNLGAALAGANVRSLSAAYETDLPPDAARAAALESLAASGWAVQPEQPMMGGGVFVSLSQPTSQAACRDGEAINVTANALDGKTYVTYAITQGNTIGACDPRSARMFSNTSSMDEDLPKLQLPTDPSTGEAARIRGSGGGSSGSRRNFRVEFQLNDAARNVASFLSRQMAEQGWTGDASWSGSTTAGSSWLKQTSTGTIHGTLQVTAVDEGQFTVILNVVPLS